MTRPRFAFGGGEFFLPGGGVWGANYSGFIIGAILLVTTTQLNIYFPSGRGTGAELQAYQTYVVLPLQVQSPKSLPERGRHQRGVSIEVTRVSLRKLRNLLFVTPGGSIEVTSCPSKSPGTSIEATRVSLRSHQGITRVSYFSFLCKLSNLIGFN